MAAMRGAQDEAAKGKSKESEARKEARIVRWQSNKRWAYGNFGTFSRSRAQSAFVVEKRTSGPIFQRA
ncbi:hypothetical protein BC2230_10019 [Burkholderia cepacia]